jgi:hypothetical protein
MAPMVEQFGNRAAESIRPEELERWLNDQAEDREWALATKNRCVALLKRPHMGPCGLDAQGYHHPKE